MLVEICNACSPCNPRNSCTPCNPCNPCTLCNPCTPCNLQFIEEEKEAILGKVSAEVVESNGVVWEHVGSTSIKGLYMTLHHVTFLIW